MLTNTERLDALESTIIYAIHKMSKFCTFDEIEDVSNSLMDRINENKQSLRDINELLSMTEKIFSDS